ncbi:MAG: hypothetical protein JSV05_00240 [Candidatus Bathyarchaeota archaeon]|nr:MAG: hypothetical protein JSV05_00240 [Candidatus Bathyarchaeota archaeon]
MLGNYANFPNMIHGLLSFTHRASSRKIQQAVATTFHCLNQEVFRLKDISYSFPANCEVIFEFGIGEDVSFAFLDKTELNKLMTEIENKTLTTLDFFCALQYHVLDSGKHTPLKFDYYFLRFSFAPNFVHFSVFHERGPRRVHVRDLMHFLIKLVKTKLNDQYSIALELATRTV